ncbi:MAG: SDR family NAD(P)-dependent oxidoreductase [Actinomycetota bacterium]
MAASLHADSRDDLRGSTVLITGANAGLGYWCSETLAGRGARVLLACRSHRRAKAASAAIREQYPSADLRVVPLDLGDRARIEACVEMLDEPIDTIICNAGVKSAPRGARTADGVELMMGTNFLGHFALLARASRLLSPRGRVVAVGSLAHRFADVDPARLTADRRDSSLRQYARSKAALMSFAFELDRRWSDTGRSALVAHPGYAIDPLTPARTGMPSAPRLLRAVAAPFRLLMQGKDEGANPIVHAATAADAVGGDFWGPGGPLEFRGASRRVPASPAVRDVAHAVDLWRAAEDITGVRFPL